MRYSYRWCSARKCRAPFFYALAVLTLFFGVLLLPRQSAQADSSYLSELTQRSREQDLASSKEWLRLLHYHSRVFGFGQRSLADDPAFFLHSDGATNPQAELEATLEAFLHVQESLEADEGAQCRFIARYSWLDEKLHFDTDRMPQHRCQRFDEFVEALQPKGVSLIFPSAYLGNPSSMFGHTLLRIDGASNEEGESLLSYAVSYAANTGADGGILFAVKGLAGGYAGVFSVEPYYQRVKAYSDIESRDIWEYRLSLNEAETLKLMEHLWELRQTNFDYYFFDENCSYHILSLLEHARPELKLSEQFVFYAIPSDTVQAITEAPGLVEETFYRPALGTTLQHKASHLSEANRRLAFGLARGETSPTDTTLLQLPEVDQAHVLEVAGEFANYQILRKSEPEESEQERAMSLLVARAGLGLQDPFPDVPIPSIRPDQGHHVARAGLGYGYEDDRSFYELQLRASYHDILDPQQGYLEGAEIEFFSLRAKHLEGDRLKLEEFLPVRILSLTPIEGFRKPISWKVRGGLVRKRVGDSLGKYLGQLRAGAGAALRVWDKGIAYGMLDTSFELSPRYGQDNLALGVGPSAGLLWDFSDKLRLGLSAHALRFEVGFDHDEFLLESELRYTLDRNYAVRLSGFRKGEFDQSWSGARVLFHVYY